MVHLSVIQSKAGIQANKQRLEDWRIGLDNLPNLVFPDVGGRNGEELATDEAAVWKRVLNYRIVKFLQPRTILETHKGLGISTYIYRKTCPQALIFDDTPSLVDLPTIDYLDIDPFGQPWDTISKYSALLEYSKLVAVSNGEAYAVTRNWTRAQKYPTQFYGKMLPKWVTSEYIPRLEIITGLKCQFYYAFPTTVRAIFSITRLPNDIFADCPQWMWWLKKYK